VTNHSGATGRESPAGIPHISAATMSHNLSRTAVSRFPGVNRSEIPAHNFGEAAMSIKCFKKKKKNCGTRREDCLFPRDKSCRLGTRRQRISRFSHQPFDTCWSEPRRQWRFDEPDANAFLENAPRPAFGPWRLLSLLVKRKGPRPARHSGFLPQTSTKGLQRHRGQPTLKACNGRPECIANQVPRPTWPPALP